MKLKKRQWKSRIIGVAISMFMALISCVPVYAAEPEMDESNIPQGSGTESIYIGEYSSEEKLTRNAVIRTCSASLNISGSTASCAGMGSAYASMANSVNLKMYLQKYSSGSWTTSAYWTTTASSTIATLSRSAAISSGTYRVKVVCSAGGETITIYSVQKTK